jgi:serine/threonine protein kinase
LNSSSLNRTIATQLWKSLDAVHEAGYLWCDCRPDNIGIYEGRPLLIDWNLAAAIGEVTNPHDGTRCYASQRLLRFPLLSPPILRTREDDLESLLKCLIEISYGKIHSLVHEQEEPCGRAAVWERHYSSFWSKDIRTALREFIECLQADMSNV